MRTIKIINQFSRYFGQTFKARKGARAGFVAKTPEGEIYFCDNEVKIVK